MTAEAAPAFDAQSCDRASLPADLGSVSVLFGAEKTRVVLSGEIDVVMVADLREAAQAVKDAGLPTVEVDAHLVTFMDSTGLAFFARLAGQGTRRPVVLRPSPPVRFLLDLTWMCDVVDIVDDDPGADTTLPEATT